MRKIILWFLIIFVSQNALSESYICSYPLYGVKELHLIKIKIDGNSADMDGHKYQVLENNDIGVVLAQSSTGKGIRENQFLGLFAMTINKKNMKFTRGNIIDGKDDNSIAIGSCVKN